MHEFNIIATFLVIAALYVGIYYVAEKVFMKDGKEE